MYLLIAVINNTDLVDDLLTGWLDMGITDVTVIESTDSLAMISRHVPIFAGFRTLTGSVQHNQTLFASLEDHQLLDQGIAFLQSLFKEPHSSNQGCYYVLPLERSGLLGPRNDIPG